MCLYLMECTHSFLLVQREWSNISEGGRFNGQVNCGDEDLLQNCSYFFRLLTSCAFLMSIDILPDIPCTLLSSCLSLPDLAGNNAWQLSTLSPSISPHQANISVTNWRGRHHALLPYPLGSCLNISRAVYLTN